LVHASAEAPVGRDRGSNVVVIDPDLADAFPTAKAVNDALREVLSRRERDDASAK
jgi:hypothetical protein